MNFSEKTVDFWVCKEREKKVGSHAVPDPLTFCRSLARRTMPWSDPVSGLWVSETRA